MPTNSGLTWTVDGAGSDAGCTITTGTLSCAFGDLAAGASKHVHITSPTAAASCGTVSNSASALSTNGGSASAGPILIKVDCPALSLTKVASPTTFTGTGTFCIGIKYASTSVKGSPAPSPNAVHYTFSTTGVPGSTQGLALKKK